MSPEKQRIAIARACGWRSMPFDYWLDPQGGHHGCFGAGDERKFLPNYLNDLNAMHEAEKVLTRDGPRSQFLTYCNTLVSICRSWPGALVATAAQRAEAFLRTLGQWEAQPTSDSASDKAPRA